MDDAFVVNINDAINDIEYENAHFGKMSFRTITYHFNTLILIEYYLIQKITNYDTREERESGYCDLRQLVLNKNLVKDILFGLNNRL